MRFSVFPTLQLFHFYLQAKQAKSPMETNGTSPLTRLITLSLHSWKNAWNRRRTLQSAENCCCGVKMSKMLKIYDGTISYGSSVQWQLLQLCTKHLMFQVLWIVGWEKKGAHTYQSFFSVLGHLRDDFLGSKKERGRQSAIERWA